MTDELHVVDPHVHLWDLSTGLYPHFETPSDGFIGNNAPIARTYPLDELLAEGGDAIAIHKIVHVEAFPTDALGETRVLQAMAAAQGYPPGLVVHGDLAAADAAARLEAQAAFGNVRGIRQVLNRHADPAYGYGAADHMANPAWRRNFDLLRKLTLSFDMQLYPHQMVDAARLAAENPDVSIILNHAGMCVDRDLDGWRRWKSGLRLLAVQPNVSVKISGLGMFDTSWTLESIRPYVLETLDVFGAGRAMFASNFPVDKLFASYRDHWTAFDTITRGFSGDERDALFRRNAERVYRL